MSSEVERFDFFAFLDGGVALLDCHQSSDGSYVRYDDYEREVRCGIAAAIRMQDKCAALEAECERLRKEKSARQALSIQLIDEARALRAELAAIKRQEPVAIAKKGNGVYWVKWTDAGKSLRGSGIKLYTLPAAPEGGDV